MMHKTFGEMVELVIEQADILLLVVDARHPEETTNHQLEAELIKQKKKFLYVVNKVDLITPHQQKAITMKNAVQISATNHLGTGRLVGKIMSMAEGKEVTVGVLGFPNTGKSSLINALKGHRSAPVSPQSGYTRSLRKVRINPQLMMIDTPGVIPYYQKESIAALHVGAIDQDKVRDPELVALKLLPALEGRIEAHFGITPGPEALERIAFAKHMLKKGGEPDTTRAAKEIIRLVQQGKIR